MEATGLEKAMNFLNEAAEGFPDAVSFLAGRPPDRFVDIAPIGKWLERYVQGAPDPAACRRMLGQYSHTNGVCRDVVARYVSEAFATPVTAANCIMTNGAQEGMLLALSVFCGTSKIALAADPTYVGFAGAATLTGTVVETVPDDGNFVDSFIERLRKSGGTIGCAYLIPDFANPSGRVLSADERRAIVAAAQDTGVVLVEDAAYRRYRYEGNSLPSLFEIAQGSGVVLLESFSKTVMPGLRAGAMVMGSHDRDDTRTMARLSSAKSYASVTTSPITQAILAGCLIEHKLDIEPLVRPKVEQVQRQRDALLAALDDSLGGTDARWTIPEGGFFLTMQLSRPFDLEDCFACAQDAHALILPMTVFSSSGQCEKDVRLSFSNIDTARCAPAVARLGDWLCDSGKISRC